MAEKILGYVELEWTCPSCNTRNPGSAVKCRQCGAPMPEDVRFEQAAEEHLITDQEALAAAQAGPDIYCAYCGTRNPATAQRCRQCAAPLVEGKTRAAGEVLGGLRDRPAPPQKCPACGADNPPTAHKCAQCGAPLGKAVPAEAVPAPARPASRPAFGLVALLLLGLLAVIIFFVVMAGRTDQVVGQVVDYGWQRVITVETLAPVTREGWRDELPPGVQVGTCRERVRQVVSQPVPNSREVCGTPYVVDTGSGYGQVKQDCQYEVLADWCQYRTLAWVVGPPLVLEGRDLNPRWPLLQESATQRAVGRSETYRVVFQANDQAYAYETRNLDEYLRLVQGKSWVLEINGFGQITGISAP